MTGPFSDYKATEIPPDMQESLFVEPKYISKLMTTQTSFIFGERGSGKTTILKYLEKVFLQDTQHDFLGVYFRFETANMRSLYSKKFDEEDNIHAFSQYIHAVLCKLICYKLVEIKENGIKFDEKSICRDVCELLKEDESVYIDTIDKLQRKFECIRKETLFAIRNRKVECLFDYNSVLQEFAMALRKNECFRNVSICVLLDEYENLTLLQQRVINSMIKNSSYLVIYKVFMRPDGIWDDNTLAEREHLTQTDDYVPIEYVKEILGKENEVNDMIRKICRNRLRFYFDKNKIPYNESDLDIDKYLENKVKNIEIDRIENVNVYRKQLIKNILKKIGKDKDEEIERMSDILELQLMSIVLEKGYSINEILINMRQNSSKYQNWKHNYETNALYIILDACGQKKIYGGLDIIIKLANYNTRMILNILSYSFENYDFTKKDEDNKISVKKQTDAIETMAEICFEQIQYIPAVGPTVKNFIQALGTLFRTFILDKQAKKFEANSFDIEVTGNVSEEDIKKIRIVIKNAIIWGILLPHKANKKKESASVSFDDKDYVLNPILCVYFKISYRKKQKNTLKDEEVMAMFEIEKKAISKMSNVHLLKKSGKDMDGQLELPINKE